MKIRSPKVAFILLLVVTSICSYIYLNTYKALEATTVKEKEPKEALEEEGAPEDVFLPDVRLIKKVIGGVQQLIPTS